MSQAAYIHHPHGPDLYGTLPANAGPDAMAFSDYFAIPAAQRVPGLPSAIRQSNPEIANAGFPSLVKAQKAYVGDFLVPLDRNHDGTVDDIILARHGQDWRTINDYDSNFGNGYNVSCIFEGHRVRFIWQANGNSPLYNNVANGASVDLCYNITKHDGTGTYGKATVAGGTGNYTSLFRDGADKKGGSVVRGEFIKRSDNRWVGFIRGFLNVTTDSNVTNMGGDYYSIQGRMVWAAGAVAGFGFGSYAGETGNLRFHVEALG